MRFHQFVLATSALFLTLTSTAPAEPPTPPPPAAATTVDSNLPDTGSDTPESKPTPTVRVSAREVIVDVLVTDSSGKPVHGLQQSDFTVQENGHPQVVRSFYESTPAASPKTKPVPLLAHEYTNGLSVPTHGPVTIFLLDQLNNGPTFDAPGRITSNLRAMAPGTQVGIFVLSPSGLHTLQPITTDRDLLIRALSTFIYDQGPPADIFGCPGDASKEWTRRMTTLRGLNQLAAYLSGIFGRKNLFWFAANPPLLLMRDGGLSWGLDDRSQDMSLVHHTMDTYEMLTAARVAVYPVMWTGLGMCFTMSHLELEKIAEDFGSINLNDSTDPNALANAVNQASQYYSLSYIPPRQELDGHYHTISVTVDKPGLTLSYRKGYNSERTPTLQDPAPGPELMKASMEGNSLPATQILFDAAIQPVRQRVAAAKPAKGAKTPPPKTFPYQIRYGFPASQIAFLEDEYGKLHGAVEFDVVAYDVRRTRVALLTQTVNMPLSIEQFDQFAAGPFQFTQQIDLPPGQLWIHVGILDTVSNRVGTLEFPVMVEGAKSMGRGITFGSPGIPIQPDNPLPCPMPCTNGGYQPGSGVSSGPTP